MSKDARRSNILKLAAGLLFVAATMIGLMLFAGFWRTNGSYKVSAYVANARGIAQNSTIFEAGLPVGQVTAVTRHDAAAVLTLRIDHGVKPLPVDSTIELGVRSLAGETDLLLAPGKSRELVRDGGSLGLSQNQAYTEVDQILTELSGTTQGDARKFFQGLGSGVNGEGKQLNRTLGGFADLVNESPPLTSTLATQHQQVADTVQYLGNIMDAISQRSEATRRFARGAQVTFRAVAARDAALKRTLDQVAYAASSHRDIVAALGAASNHLNPVVSHLARTLLKLEPTLKRLQPASARGLTLVRELGAASPSLKSLLVNLRRLEPSATKALPAVHSTLCQAGPMARFLKPYGPDIAHFFQNFGAAVDSYLEGKNKGHQLLTSAHIDPQHLFRGIVAKAPDEALSTLFNSGLFTKISQSEYGYHALPGPGHMGDPTLRAEGPIQWGANHPFPRLVADCAK